MPSTNDSAPRMRISPTQGWGGAILCLLILAFAAYHFTRQTPSVPKIGGPFTLTASDGRQVSDADFRGKWMLIYFGYSFCPDICPTTLATISDALSELGPQADGVQPIFITVDPERDTKEVLAAFAGNFDRRLVALTGTPAEIAAVESEFHVFASKVPNEAHPGEYLMDHTSLLYLIPPDGRSAIMLPASQDGAPLAAALKSHLGSAS